MGKNKPGSSKGIFPGIFNVLGAVVVLMTLGGIYTVWDSLEDRVETSEETLESVQEANQDLREAIEIERLRLELLTVSLPEFIESVHQGDLTLDDMSGKRLRALVEEKVCRDRGLPFNHDRLKCSGLLPDRDRLGGVGTQTEHTAE